MIQEIAFGCALLNMRFAVPGTSLLVQTPEGDREGEVTTLAILRQREKNSQKTATLDLPAHSAGPGAA